MRTLRIAAAALAFVLAAHPLPASADPAPGPWSQQGRDAGWSFYQDRPGGLALGSAGRLAQRWSRPGLSDGDPNIAYYGGWLYAAFADRTIRRLDPATGAVRAPVLRAPWAVSQLVVTADGIYLRSTTAVAAFDLDGRRRWVITLGPQEPHVNPFVYAAGRIVLVSGPECAEFCPAPDRVRVLRADTGRQVWTAPADGHADQAPLVVDGILQQEAHPSGKSPQTTAYRLKTGAVLWRHRDWPVPVAGRPGQLYSADPCVLSPATGAQRWCRNDDAGMFRSLAVAPDAVFAYAQQTRELVRFSAAGRVSWRCPLDAGAELAPGSPVVGGGVVYAVVDHPGRSSEVIAWNATTGAVVRRLPFLPPLSSSELVLAAGHLYVTNRAWARNQTTLYALGADRT